MVFFTFWDGPQLSIYENLCLQSFLKHGFELKIYSYNHFLNENKAINYAAEKVIKKSIFKDFGSLSSFANYFRYVALQSVEKGSTWVDLDVLCMSSSWPESQYIIGFETKKRLNNAVLRIPHDSILLKKLIENSIKNEIKIYGETGPYLITKVIKKYGKDLHLFPINAFYPISHWELDLFFDPSRFQEANDRLRDSYALHLYNELLIRAAIPKNVLPPEGSFLHHQFLKYLPDSADLVTLNSDWLRGWRRNFAERRILNQIAQLLGPLKNPIKHAMHFL